MQSTQSSTSKLSFILVLAINKKAVKGKVDFIKI